MATLTFKQLFAPTQLSAGANTLYTCPTATLARNLRVRFANTTSGAVSIQAWAVPSAGTAGDSNSCLPTKSIGAYSYIDVDIPLLTSSDYLVATPGAATSITATCIDGFEQT